jgi:hypothetical protein
MIVYLHMHKCAGTSVIRAARASGLRLPQAHRNGNLVDAAGTEIKFRRMGADAVVALLRRQIDAGVEFMAMEWDFPALATLDRVGPLRLFTSLRDPLARAISNFKMDKVAGWIDPAITFTDYVDADALYRADNYYVKMLGARWPADAMSEADLDHALAVLARFERVIVVEQGNMAAVLAAFGITPGAVRANAFNHGAARKRLGGDRRLWVGQDEMRAFIARNALDYRLYRHATRALRGAVAA